MSRSFVLATILAVVLVFASVQNGFAAIEIAYDDGSAEGRASGPAGQYLAVRFSIPIGLPTHCAKLVTARFYKVPPPLTNVWVHILNSDGSADMPGTTPFIFDIAVNNAWNDADLTGQSILVSGDFWIAARLIVPGDPYIGEDYSGPWDARSFLGVPGNWILFGTPQEPIDLMIRAVVDPSPCPSPVGGVVIPANTLALIAPWLAVIGLVGCIGTLVVVARKRRS